MAQPSGIQAITAQGFDILRLASPNVEDMNEDFLCGICKSKIVYLIEFFLEIVNNP